VSFSGHERHCAYLNTRGERFADVSSVSGLDWPDDGRAAALVDWDQDGDLDVWFSNRNAPQLRFLRNDRASAGRSLSIRLESTSGNRDAIGARVALHLEGVAAPILRTVKAGAGFLAQSSKWLHFGLGADGKPARLVVRWPSGQTAEWEGLEAGGRYRIREGDAQARPWARKKTAALSPIPLDLPEPTRASRVVLAGPLPLPSFGAGTRLDQLARAPVEGVARLLLFWSATCPACRREIEGLIAARPDLERAGISILAVRVDGRENDPLASIDFPFDRADAQGDTLDIVQTLINTAFAWREDAVSPTSLLLDKQGRVAAIYRGVVGPKRLLQDRNALLVDDATRRGLSVPFDGRWTAPAGKLRLDLIAKAFLDAGHAEAGILIAADHGAFGAEDREFAKLLDWLATQLVKREQTDRAIGLLELAIRIAPEFRDARVQLGLTYQKRGEAKLAITQLRAGVSGVAEPAPILLNQLAWLLVTAPDLSAAEREEGLRWARLADARVGDRQPSAKLTLAVALYATRQPDEAKRVGDAAIELARKQGRRDLEQAFVRELERAQK